MEMRVSNTSFRASKILFHFSADPPALSVVNEDASEAFWIEFADENQLVALDENLSHYLNKRYRQFLVREQKKRDAAAA